MAWYVLSNSFMVLWCPSLYYDHLQLTLDEAWNGWLWSSSALRVPLLETFRVSAIFMVPNAVIYVHFILSVTIICQLCLGKVVKNADTLKNFEKKLRFIFIVCEILV